MRLHWKIQFSKVPINEIILFREDMTQSDKTILEVQHLSNQYDDQPLLQNVSFSLMQGEILCLLGPSGSGKTTLLRIIAGLETDISGSITFRGQDICKIPTHKRKFGMMFQEYALFPHRTVWQNVAFGLEMQKTGKENQDRKIRAMLELVRLSGFEHRKIDELSGGERQRVALARSLAPEPQLLLLDEPLGSLDRTLRDRLTREIRTILKTLNVTAVFVTHDQAEAFSVADKIAVLHTGCLQQFSTPEKIYRTPANKVVARFLGFRNFIQGELDDRNIFRSSLGKFELVSQSKTNQGPCTLLLRPDGARLSTSHDDSAFTHKMSGTVESRQFQGSSYNMVIRTAEYSLAFDLPLDPHPPVEGDRIELALLPSALVLMP